jgi:hypothetical protein
MKKIICFAVMLTFLFITPLELYAADNLINIGDQNKIVQDYNEKINKVRLDMLHELENSPKENLSQQEVDILNSGILLKEAKLTWDQIRSIEEGKELAEKERNIAINQLTEEAVSRTINNSDYTDTIKGVMSTTYLGNFSLSSSQGGIGLGGSDWTSGMKNRNGSFAGIAGTRWATGMATSSFTPSSSGVYYFGADFRVVGRNLGAYANMKLRVIDTVTNAEQTITLLTPGSGFLDEYFTKGGTATLVGGRKYTVIFQVDTSVSMAN